MKVRFHHPRPHHPQPILLHEWDAVVAQLAELVYKTKGDK